MSHNIIYQTKPSDKKILEYEPDDSMIIIRLIGDLQNQLKTREMSFAQQYILQKGLNVFGQRGYEAAIKKVNQLHIRKGFKPLDVNELKREAEGEL